jgi:uncharacterized Rmd1/YagE family protein
MASPLSDLTRVPVHAVLVGGRIDLRRLDRQGSPYPSPLAVPAGTSGLAVLFQYGAVVLFNVARTETAAFLRSLDAVIEEPLPTVETESAEILVDTDGEERVDANGAIRLHSTTTDRIIVVADILAKSVALAYHETRVARVFDNIEPVAEALCRSGPRRRFAAPELLDHIGDVMITQHRMVGRVEVTEKPLLLWDRSDLDRLYGRLKEEYELLDRDSALTRKLDLVSQTAMTSLGLLQAKRSLRVEWYIVILIVIEILLTLYELFISPAMHG